jgi:hypothetical protein
LGSAESMPTCRTCSKLFLFARAISDLALFGRAHRKQPCKKTDRLGNSFCDNQNQSGSKAASGKAKWQSETKK